MTLLLTTLKSYSYSSTVLLFTAVTLTIYFIIKTLTGSKRNGLPLPPGLPSVPVLGSAPFMAGIHELPAFFRKTAQRLGPVFSVKIGSQYAVVLNTREVIYEALVRKAGSFSGRLSGYTNVKFLNPNGHGIISKQYGDAFRRYHKLSLSILKEFGFGSSILEDRILTEVEQLVEIIKEHGGKSLDPNHIFSICTLNVIASIVFGQRISQKDSVLDSLFDTLRYFAQDNRRHVDVSPALLYLPKYKKVVADSVENQRKQLDIIRKFASASLNSERGSFVKRFIEIEGNDNYDKDELNFIIRDLLIAGSETSSNTTQFAMILMANHQEVQKRVQLEIDSVVERKSLVTLNHMPRIPYVEATILEIARYDTEVPLALPHYTLDDAQLSGFFIPKGSVVYPNLYSAHMDPKLFEAPEKFNPERFLNDEGQVTGRDLVIPYSVGKRSCLGELLARQEVFLIITNLLHEFNILPPEGQDRVDVTKSYMITSFPSPFQLRFVPRN